MRKYTGRKLGVSIKVVKSLFTCTSIAFHQRGRNLIEIDIISISNSSPRGTLPIASVEKIMVLSLPHSAWERSLGAAALTCNLTLGF